MLLVCLFFLVSSSSILVSGQFPCGNLMATDGSTYDLTRLAALGSISGTDSNAFWNYKVSVCGNHVTCGTTLSGYCQLGSIGGINYTFNVGYLDASIPKPDGGGVELIYFDPVERRAGRVIITCDPRALVSNINVITPTPENPQNYEFRFSSVAGCTTIPPCKALSPTAQRSYDLSAFIGTSPIIATDDIGEYQYRVTICQNSISNCGMCNTAGYCQSAQGGQQYCIGAFQNITGYDNGTGVLLQYLEPSFPRIGKVFIKCDPTAGLVSDVTAISPTTPEGYEFYITSYAACPQHSCKVTAPDGTYYDLSSLVLSQPLSGVDSERKWNYSVSICENSLKCANCDNAGYCQTELNLPHQYCVGSFDGIEGLNSGQGVKLLYKEPKEGRIGTVTVSCDPNGPLVSDISVVSPDELTGYQFNFKSRDACPSTKK